MMSFNQRFNQNLILAHDSLCFLKNWQLLKFYICAVKCDIEVSNGDANVDWAAVQKYLQEIKLSEGRFPSRGSSAIGVSYSPQGGGSRGSAAGSGGVVVIQSGQGVVAGGSSSGSGGGFIRTATTPPPLNVAASATVASPSSASLPTSVAELFSLLNGILRDLGLTAVSPAAVNIIVN
jgi:hypothetical protein